MINWIAVEDRLPEDDAVKLVWHVYDRYAHDAYRGGTSINAARYDPNDGSGVWLWLDYRIEGVTHWAELSDINPPGAKEGR